jgi:hypothetical protein
VVGLMVAVGTGLGVRAEAPAPSTVFELSKWKLQIPGPLEVKHLAGYSSPYFHLNSLRELVFHLDASEEGPTRNTKFVRSELRHLPQWSVNETHSLLGEFSVSSRLTPDKVTVLQIHGITESGGDAPPLLRIAVNQGDLVAVLKTSNDGEKNDTIPLRKHLGSRFVKVEVTVKNRQLTIAVDGQTKVKRTLDYWKFPNYFKAGCYPQATRGTAEITFRKLTAQ